MAILHLIPAIFEVVRRVKRMNTSTKYENIGTKTYLKYLHGKKELPF